MAGGYAATVMNFISDTGHDPRDRLGLLLREQWTVSEDIDQLYRWIIASSENPDLHYSHFKSFTSSSTRIEGAWL